MQKNLIRHEKGTDTWLKSTSLNNVKVTDKFGIAQMFNDFLIGAQTKLQANTSSETTDSLSFLPLGKVSYILYLISAGILIILTDNLENF